MSRSAGLLAGDPPDAATWLSWGVDPAWSQTIAVDGADGRHRWHLLDTGPALPGGRTIVCVHGNPTWAYAWIGLLGRLAPTHRVVAIDQLGMGFSDRRSPRTYAQRVADLDDVIATLDLLGSDDRRKIVLAGHDWGGAIALGWAVDHIDRLEAMVLCNTAIAVPADRAAPALIRLAAMGPLRRTVCEWTPMFVEATLRLSRGALSRVEREAFRAPYRHRARRTAIADFVGDVPLRADHPSAPDLAAVGDRLGDLDAPVLLIWGSTDPVFGDDFAADLAGRLPNVQLHRFPTANHLVMAEVDVAGVVERWLADLASSHRAASVLVATPSARSLWSSIADRAASGGADDALVDMATGASATWQQLNRRVAGTAAELRHRGLQPGDRVGVLTPPSVKMITLMYAVWRAGGVTVLADRGLGFRGLGRAVRSARVRWTIGSRQAAVASRALRWAPGAEFVNIDELMVAAGTRPSSAADDLTEPAADDIAAILFTSGSTGPAKGVIYTHAQLAAQRDALARTYSIEDGDRLVAAFAPFALYGPALRIATALPDCDVTAPCQLTAAALGAAVERIEATVVFASPSALSNVVATFSAASASALPSVRMLMSAGAPVPSELLRDVAQLVPNAALHTPYGMTEILPVTDIDLETITDAEAATPAAGVCVGFPVVDAEVMVAPLAFDAGHGTPEPVATGITGEILARASWCSDGYLGLWDTQRQNRPGDGWHRSGDVGHLDLAGRLWVEGRAVHMIAAVDGPITSVRVERAVETAGIPIVRPGRVAAVGVGPAGVQQLVIVVEQPGVRFDLASPGLTAAVRAVVPHPVAAVIVDPKLPVDIRHNAKIDRAVVAARAAHLLGGSGIDRVGP